MALSNSIPIANLKIPVFGLVTIGVGLAAAAAYGFSGKNTDWCHYSSRNGQPGNDRGWVFVCRLSSPVCLHSVHLWRCCGLFGAQSLVISLDIGWDVLLLSMMLSLSAARVRYKAHLSEDY